MDALADSSDVFETFFDQARIGLALADLTKRYVRVNDTYAAMLGRSPEDLIGVSFAQVLHPDDRDDDAEDTALLLSGEVASLQSEERYVGADGGVTWVLHGVTVVRDREGAPAWFAVSAQDITERRRAEQDLRELTAVLTEQAVRDPLTGLANRTLLEERLRTVLARDARTGDATALLFLDLDGFKRVNDVHGHTVGDAVLRTVGQRLAATVRPSDTVARMGGDEFVVLVESAHDEGVQALVSRLSSALSAPVTVGSGAGAVEIAVGVSIGVAVSVRGEADPVTLLTRADEAMYVVKRGPRTP